MYMGRIRRVIVQKDSKRPTAYLHVVGIQDLNRVSIRASNHGLSVRWWDGVQVKNNSVRRSLNCTNEKWVASRPKDNKPAGLANAEWFLNMIVAGEGSPLVMIK